LPWYFWPAKEIFSKHDCMKNSLPDGVNQLIIELKNACTKYDYCEKENEMHMKTGLI
jgi:hypothetical protein